jgi:hypothetical protein
VRKRRWRSRANRRRLTGAGRFSNRHSLRLLMRTDDLRPTLEHRRAGHFALRLVPDYPGKARPVFPRQWLKPLATG